MSLCNRCFQPGVCCRRMSLTDGDGKDFAFWSDEGDMPVKQWLTDKGLPFHPIEPSGQYVAAGTGREYQTWAYGCTKLDEQTGRCMIYDQRPSLCRTFEPASDGLCVHFGGAEGGE